MERKSININSQVISYLELARNKEETLLFLHGWGCDSTIFLPIINSISNKNIIAVDFPGFGESPEPEQVWGIKEYTDNLREFIKMKKLKNITIVAHSFGARITIALLASSNLSIKRIILTGGAGIKPKRTWKYYLGIGNYKFKKFLVRTPFYFQYKNDLFAMSGSEDYQNASKRMKEILIKVVNQDLSPLLKNINVSTDLFWGENDEATPIEDAKIMNREIPNSKLEVVKGTHYAFLEAKEKFIKVIERN